MPYIAIKAYPKDEETKAKVAEKINQVFLEEWGCPPEAISSVSIYLPIRSPGEYFFCLLFMPPPHLEMQIYRRDIIRLSASYCRIRKCP